MKAIGSEKKYKKLEETEIQFLSTQLQEPQKSTKYSLITAENIVRRQIHLIDEITEDTFEQVKNLYDALIEDNVEEPIHFIVGTAGGDVSSMMGIMNLMILSQTPCYTYLLGETCSAGSWIYLAGHKRFAPKTGLASIMLHPMEWDSSNSLGNHDSHNKYVGNLCKKLIEFTSGRTKLSKAKLHKLAFTETQYFVGDELFKYGIATDELTTSAFWVQPKKEEPVSSSPKPRKKKKVEPLVEG